MNNNERDFKQRRKKKSFLKENGLIIGLYSVVGVLVVSAGVLTVKNFSLAEDIIVGDNLTPNSELHLNIDDVDSKSVNSDTGVSYKDQAEGEIGIAVSSNVGNIVEKTKTKKTNIEEVVPEKENNDQSNNVKPQEENNETSPENNSEDGNPITTSEKEEKETDEESNLKKIDINEDIELEEKTDEKNNKSEKKSSNNDVDKEDEEDEEKSTPTIKTVVEESIQTNNAALYRAFDENDTMIWPVVGEILMPFSEEFILDITLDQYRTNDTVRIESTIGSNVQASFDGEVTKVGNTYEDGYFIVLSHGNGWSSIYSQLNKNLLVSEGEVVSKGQIIGTVEAPTRRYTSLDTHLGFRIEKDLNTINPQLVLKD